MIDDYKLAKIREGLLVFSGGKISVDQLVNDYISFVVTGKPEDSIYDIKAVSMLAGIFSDEEVENG